MLQLMVDDLDAWWSHIESLDLPRHFGVPFPKPPAMQPWGLRVAYVVDPAGVLWHFAERRDGIGHDNYPEEVDEQSDARKSPVGRDFES